jgi:hypothetical protein
VVVVALVLTLVLLGGDGQPNGRPTVGGSGASSGGPGVGTFAFASAKVTSIRISKKVAAPDVGDAAEEIQVLLGRLYDQGVVARATRSAGPPASYWEAFAPDIRQRAQADRLAFTLGSAAGSLEALDISSSSLTIRFLIDDRGAALSAVASASIHGTGQLEGSGPVELLVTGTFLFREVSGAWLIAGYPSAAVTVASPGAASPAPGASTESPSAEPSGSATP